MNFEKAPIVHASLPVMRNLTELFLKNDFFGIMFFNGKIVNYFYFDIIFNNVELYLWLCGISFLIR